MPSDTLSQSLNAGQWAFINTVLQRVIAFGTFFILARILLPSDFGIIALLTVVPSFIEGVTALAFDTAVVQKQGDIRQYLNAIWTFTILRGLIIFLIVFAVSPFIADFFHITYALPALRLAGLGIFLNSLVNIGQTYFFIELDFKKVFIRDMVLSLSYSIAAISLALVLHSYWALFIGNILSILAVVVATYVLHPYRPRFDLSFSKLGVLLPFSKWLLGQELLNQLVRTAEDSLMGRFTTPMALGLYGKAKSLAIAPTAPLSSLIGKVGFTSYARAQDSLAQVREGIAKTFDVMLAISLPYLFLIGFAGNRIVLIALGPNWVAITPYLKLLTLSATVGVLTVSLATPVFNAIGKPRIQFVINSTAAASTLLGLLLLVPPYGIWGASIAMLLGTIVTAAVTLYSMLTLLQTDIMRFVTSTVSVLVALLTPVTLAWFCLSIPFFNTTLGYLILIFLAGSLYLFMLAFLGKTFKTGPFSTLLIIAKSVLNSPSIVRFCAALDRTAR